MNKHFLSDYQNFIYTSRYSRWLPNEQRREYWNETVTRYMDFMKNHLRENQNYDMDPDLYSELWDNIYNLDVMPSMRSLMTAGPALTRDNTAGYNCSYLPVDDPKAFDEAMFILMCGTGVGFSVERQYVQKLPEIPDRLYDSDTSIVVKDSKEGWAKSLRMLISLLYAGEVPKWDTSKVRPAGERLHTFGGRASGPGPLEDLFKFVISKFKNGVGRRLSSIECHDIMCKIGEIVVVGGVRRSAMISLSNLSDDRMRSAKSGQWWENNGQRALANNSAAYTEKPDVGVFMQEWTSLYESKSGERGIVNREAAQRKAGENGRRDNSVAFGTNPCGEIILRPYQFCNLSEIVVRPTDDFARLLRKAKLASILGTFQSTLVHFPYLRKVWTKNTEEERLLGVSLTGIMDHAILNGTTRDTGLWHSFCNDEDAELDYILTTMKEAVIETNRLFAELLEIPQSVATTTVKPSGTVSQLVNSSSGIHARHSEYYIRSVRADNKDPLTEFLKDGGVYNEPDVMKPDNTTVFFFPMKSPDNAVTRDQMSAIQQLEMWKLYKTYWCEHNPSITVTVREEEWPSVGGWVYDHFDLLSGVSFLPYSEHTYRQAPYDECDEGRYQKMLETNPVSIDWSKLKEYESSDNTVGSQSYACSGDSCEIVDLT